MLQSPGIDHMNRPRPRAYPYNVKPHIRRGVGNKSSGFADFLPHIVWICLQLLHRAHNTFALGGADGVCECVLVAACFYLDGNEGARARGEDIDFTIIIAQAAGADAIAFGTQQPAGGFFAPMTETVGALFSGLCGF